MEVPIRYTLLELTQSILRSMESDEVSDINETQEAKDVVDIIKESYFDIVGEMNMAEQEGLFKLDSSGDNTKPTLMYVPSTVSRIQWLKYNIDDSTSTPNNRDVRYVNNQEFLYYQQGLDPSDTTISQMTVSINGSDFVFHYHNNSFPTYYTIFDERNIIFDSYDSSIESTLTTVRTVGWGDLVPSFTLSNNWVPDLDPRQFQLLLQASKSTAFMELKQTQNARSEKQERKNRILTQKNKNDNDPNWSNQKHAQYGRQGRVGYPRDAFQRSMRQGS